MRKILLPSLLALMSSALPCLGVADAQEAPPRAATTTASQATDTTTNADAPQKRGISEEGGMKASGPSQGKGGESR